MANSFLVETTAEYFSELSTSMIKKLIKEAKKDTHVLVYRANYVYPIKGNVFVTYANNELEFRSRK